MEVTVENLKKAYGNVTAVDGVDLVAEEGELTTFLGPSGCGKTTTLRCIAGLEDVDTGRITIGDTVVTDTEAGVSLSPQRRDIGFVFQSFDVWPHMDVFDNVAYPLRIRKLPEDEIEEKVVDILSLSNIEGLRNNPASELSGGQQARVGICRALVYEPKVLLCDEPLTGLDRNLRKEMRNEIRRIQSEVGITTIYVTHSQPEAMAISDKICLMNTSGKIEQIGTAREIYDAPASQYVLDFFGASEKIAGRVSDGAVATEFGTLDCDVTGFDSDDEVIVGFRPKDVMITRVGQSPDGGENTFEAVVQGQQFLGESYELDLRVGDQAIQTRLTHLPDATDVGDAVWVTIDPADLFVYPARGS